MSKSYKVSGMTCGGCAGSVERAIKAKAPGAKVSVELSSGKVTVDGVADDQVIKQAVEGAGFQFQGAA